MGLFSCTSRGDPCQALDIHQAGSTSHKEGDADETPICSSRELNSYRELTAGRNCNATGCLWAFSFHLVITSSSSPPSTSLEVVFNLLLGAKPIYESGMSVQYYRNSTSLCGFYDYRKLEAWPESSPPGPAGLLPTTERLKPHPQPSFALLPSGQERFMHLDRYLDLACQGQGIGRAAPP